jgi:hypothetical protein
MFMVDHLCGLVVRVPGYRSRGQDSIPDAAVVGLERGPLSLVSTIEELLEEKSSGSDLETKNTAVGTRRADHETPLYPQKLALTSPTSGGLLVGIVRSWTRATEFFLYGYGLSSRKSSAFFRTRLAVANAWLLLPGTRQLTTGRVQK